MIKILSFLLVALMVAQTGCLPKRMKVDQLWFYSYSSNQNETENSITPANFLSLQPDGSYTRDFGKFEEGTWEEKNSTLYLKSKTGVIEFPIKSLSNDLQLVSSKGTVLLSVATNKRRSNI